jgi:hypothetical protein
MELALEGDISKAILRFRMPECGTNREDAEVSYILLWSGFAAS